MTLIHKSDITSLNKSLHTSHFPGGSDSKNPPAIQETIVQSLGWEDPLEEGMVTHSSILVWRIPRTEEPGGLQSMGSQRVRHDWVTKHTQHTVFPHNRHSIIISFFKPHSHSSFTTFEKQCSSQHKEFSLSASSG